MVDIFDYPRYSPEAQKVLSLAKIDGWTTRESDLFENSLILRRVKNPRKNVEVHYDLAENIFYKVAVDPRFTKTVVDKEAKIWDKVSHTFETGYDVTTGYVHSERSRRATSLKYLQMSNYGVPIRHFAGLVRRRLPQETIDEFVQNLSTLNGNGIYLPDLNPGNILVRIEYGDYKLVPIDFEAAVTKGIFADERKALTSQERSLNETLRKFA
jgi:hypothetical protein